MFKAPPVPPEKKENEAPEVNLDPPAFLDPLASEYVSPPPLPPMPA